MFEKLEETFGVVPMSVQDAVVVKEESLPVVVADNVEDAQDKADQELARETFKRMIQKSENMLEALTQIAAGTEHPRAFEVAANLVKTITDVATKLDEVASRKSVQKQKAPKGEESQGGATTNVSNHLYVGSSDELINLIRNGGVKQAGS